MISIFQPAIKDSVRQFVQKKLEGSDEEKGDIEQEDMEEDANSDQEVKYVAMIHFDTRKI